MRTLLGKHMYRDPKRALRKRIQNAQNMFGGRSQVFSRSWRCVDREACQHICWRTSDETLGGSGVNLQNKRRWLWCVCSLDQITDWKKVALALIKNCRCYPMAFGSPATMPIMRIEWHVWARAISNLLLKKVFPMAHQ